MSTQLQDCWIGGRLYLSYAPVSGTEAVRKSDLDTALAQLPAPGSQPVGWQAITDADEEVRRVVEDWLIESPSVTWTSDANGLAPQVKFRVGGGLLLGISGLEIDPSAVPGMDHGHPQLHDPAQGAATPSAEVLVSGQVLRVNVLLKPGGGLVMAQDGVSVDFGPGENQVMRGNQQVGGQSHPALTVAGSPTLDLALDGPAQALTGSVRRSISPVDGVGLEVDENGLFVPTGPSGTQAARGDHSHALATSGTSGMLSAGDFSLLRRMETLDTAWRPTPEMIVSWCQESPLVPTGTLPGYRQWSRPVRLIAASATAMTASAPEATQLRMLWEGESTPKVLNLGASAPWSETSASVSLADVYVPPDTPIRWRATSASSNNDGQHWRVDVGVSYEIAEHPVWRVNCGGPAVYPWIAERLSLGGTPMATFEGVNASLVQDAAPDSVYQTCNTRVDGQPLVYTFTACAPLGAYKVRAHFADIGFGGAAGECEMTLTVTGDNQQTHEVFDVYQLAGGTFRAAVIEVEINAHDNGTIEVRVDPAPGTNRSFVSGIEVIPDTD